MYFNLTFVWTGVSRLHARRRLSIAPGFSIDLPRARYEARAAICCARNDTRFIGWEADLTPFALRYFIWSELGSGIVATV